MSVYEGMNILSLMSTFSSNSLSLNSDGRYVTASSNMNGSIEGEGEGFSELNKLRM